MLASLLLAATLAASPKPDAKPPLVLNIYGQIDSSFEMVNEIDKAKDDKVPYIHVNLNTPGGSIGEGLEIIRALNNSGLRVECEVKDYALSMGAIILESACSERIVHTSSLVMFHEAVGNGTASTQDVAEDQVAMFHAFNRMVALRVAPALHLTVDQYAKKVRDHQWWILGETAVADSVADKVLPDPHPVK